MEQTPAAAAMKELNAKPIMRSGEVQGSMIKGVGLASAVGLAVNVLQTSAGQDKKTIIGRILAEVVLPLLVAAYGSIKQTAGRRKHDRAVAQANADLTAQAIVAAVK